MFYEFASESIYPEREWPFVWRIETVLAAVIRAHSEEVVRMSIEDLSGGCLRWIDELNLLDIEDKERANEYVNTQIESIFSYVQEHQESLLHNRLRIGLVPHFSQYLAYSPTFSAYLQSRPICGE